MKNETRPAINTLIHEPARLSIMATLDECLSVDFMFLAGVTSLTRGNLSTHLAKLVDAGYVSESKEFVERKPRSEYSITEQGRKAYKEYLKEWARITGQRK
jgi:DNA-binding MarR family transcriptional regulator